ncbi:dihydrofolate reductase family protein [Micromonospora sp. BRA006-A]|nr:dihydrofolate reductase family protein [Micromonospora sp. BRA006-A]
MCTPDSCRSTASWTPRGGPARTTAAAAGSSRTSSSCPRRSRSRARLAQTTALMFGRRSYAGVRADLARLGDHAAYRDLPKYVVSSSLPEDALIDGWGPLTILRSTADVAALKQGDGGDVFIHGSAELARRLAEADLIDRYHLLVFPVLLGAGKGLFSQADRDRQTPRLRDSAAYPNGVVKLIYDVTR